MQKKESPPHDEPLGTKFGGETKQPDRPHSTSSNVIPVNFGRQKRTSFVDPQREKDLLEHILQNAQKLDW